ncbi:MAG: nicotinate phosphoribosyltransferase [Deltaproteobacteria bacterium]|nr:nicotinate phosphoribosyltransferase [Deltaproteobacteria bacterium]
MKESDKKTAEGMLFSDQYQLTMAQLYFRMGIHEKRVQFDHFFRNYPDYGSHKAGYCINAGLEWLIDWMQNTHFRDEDIELLRSQTGITGKQLFDEDFLRWLRANGSFESISVLAIPEGRVVHPNVPLTVVQGALAMAQILESPLLNQLNYQTLIATKAARIHEAGRGQTLIEFGMRRGHERGVNAGIRAAFIGGADFTSTVGISHVLGYPPKGTHAHSMVQVFMALGEGEIGAFRAYADVYPDDCLLLVDTINTIESGIPNAIKVFEELKRKGHEPVGIRLDSGDLAYLSIQAAKMLNDAGFPNTKIVLSNQLDELVIWQIITQIEEEAPRYRVDADKLIQRLIYGVGTRLITSKGDAALDGVYKLVGVEERAEWIPAIKISETPSKTLNPGFKHVWRIYDMRAKATADLLSLDANEPMESSNLILHHPLDHTKYRILSRDKINEIEPLLTEVLTEGKLNHDHPSIEEIRKIREEDLDRLDSGVKRIVNPHIYHVSLSQRLWELKQSLIKSLNKETILHANRR